jgi:hypothetical protein
VPDQTTIAENRELKRRIIELEEQLERERRHFRRWWAAHSSAGANHDPAVA